MTVQNAEGTEKVTEESNQDQHQESDPKPTETVEFWKNKARDWENRSKANKTAADELAQIKEAQKSDEQKRAERDAALQAEVDSVPAKVAEALKAHLVTLHGIDDDDAELFLTGTTPELLLKQVTRLTEQSGAKKKPNFVAREGNSPKPTETDERTFARDFFGGD